jgi:hypothetical protein
MKRWCRRGTGLASAQNWAGVGAELGWYFVLACDGGGPLLGRFFVKLQVSSLLLWAILVGFKEAFFRPPVVVPAVADLVLAGLGKEVADACSIIRLRLNGGDGLMDLAAVNSRLASSWPPVRTSADRWRWRLGRRRLRERRLEDWKFSNRALGLCLFISFSSRVFVYFLFFQGACCKRDCILSLYLMKIPFALKKKKTISEATQQE